MASGLVPWGASLGKHLMNFLVIMLSEVTELRQGQSRNCGKLLLSFAIEKLLY